MSDPSPFSRLSDPQDADVVQYRSVSALALAGLLVGLFSWVAYFAPVLWAVPALAVLLCVAALARISRNPTMLLGRPAALAGLTLAVFFAAAGVTDWYVYREAIRDQARQYAAVWFNLVAHGQAMEAHQLAGPPGLRQPLNEDLPKHYYEGSEARYNLEHYVQRPEVALLLNLGDRANARYYATETQAAAQGRDMLAQIYAVTHPSDAGPKTFFLRVLMERQVIRQAHQSVWQISGLEGGFVPDALEALPHTRPAGG